jgi:hypothetical protein
VAVAELGEAEAFASSCVELIKAWVRLGDRRLEAGAGAVVGVDGVAVVVLVDNVPNRLELRSES